jgi:hypothetical protein
MLCLSPARKSGWALALVVALSGGCADPGKDLLTKRPPPSTAEGGAAAQRKVVLFRLLVEAGGVPLDAPWTVHWSGLRLFTVVGPANARLGSLTPVEPGALDTSSSDNGWAFVALPPGGYQLAFEGTAVRFSMPGAHYTPSDMAMPVGRSPPVVFAVPSDPQLFYIGTFRFGCERMMDRTESLRLDCAQMDIRSEVEGAREVARRALADYGAPAEVPAVRPGQQP